MIAVYAACLGAASAQVNVRPQRSDPGPEALYGTWGTPAQCAAHAAGGNTDMRLFPYVISNDWIQHGVVYCYVSWHEYHGGAKSMQAHAYAQCGEDAVRDYRVFLNLHRGELRIRWSKDFTTAILQACE